MFKKLAILLVALLLMSSFAVACNSAGAAQMKTTQPTASVAVTITTTSTAASAETTIPAQKITQTQAEKNSPAIMSSAAPLEKDIVITRKNIVVGDKFKLEVVGKFTIDFKLVSGNGKKISEADWVPGASYTTTDPQIKLTIEILGKDGEYVQFIDKDNFPNNYFLKINSLDANGQAIGKTRYLLYGPFGAGNTFERVFVLEKPSECKGFEIRLGYNKP
jgi:hypothetical protein